MNAKTAKLLREYAAAALPQPVRRKYPAMVGQLQRALKVWWNAYLSAKEREEFRRLAERLGPLPDRLKRFARDRGIIVEWPRLMERGEPKKPRRRDWGKPKSWRHRQYGPRRAR